MIIYLSTYLSIYEIQCTLNNLSGDFSKECNYFFNLTNFAITL